jgi:pilus assembly protein Flp/PilA
MYANIGRVTAPVQRRAEYCLRHPVNDRRLRHGARLASGRKKDALAERKVLILHRFIKDESGATAVEYGLIAALICVVIISAVTSLGTSLQSQFERVAKVIAAPTPTPPPTQSPSQQP